MRSAATPCPLLRCHSVENVPACAHSIRHNLTLRTCAQGANLNLTLVYMRSKTFVSYMSRNGLVANNMQLETGDLDMAVTSFSVPPGVAQGSCSFTLQHMGPLQQQEERLQQV